MLTRRRALLGVSAAGAALVALRCGLPGALRHAAPTPLPADLQAWVDGCFSDVDKTKLWDCHAHLVGRGHGTDCFVSPELQSRLHPVKNFQFELYAAGAGLPLNDSVDDHAYLVRLLALHRLANPAGKLVLMAFDMHVDVDGVEVPALSEFFTPNGYVLQVARDNPDVVACASVHPYRKDAIKRLTHALDAGARAVKWLPNAMGIDPADARCDGFFDVLAERKVPLITHTGDEAAVDAKDAQALGNPQRLARALDRGVCVVAAHVASLGACAAVSCTDVLLEMMQRPAWTTQLFADISATTQFNRAGPHLAQILSARDLHARFVNGSDYPLPAIDPLVSTRYLVAKDLLDDDDRVQLNRVFSHNPLLFDFLLKRKVRVNGPSGAQRFAPQVFETSWLFSRVV